MKVCCGHKQCSTLFLSLALILDIVGLILLLIGIFAPLSFWDFFVLSGPLLIFLSLIFWIFWYIADLTVSEEELNLPKQDIL
uniref:Transmembrane protein 238 like n=1 Tax=Amphilophus citrinellus TaxID=61819 RepID=A0A3Q0RYT0_AMPCI